MPQQFQVTPGPHVATTLTTERIMREVFGALVPASIAAVYFFGLHALVVILASIAAAIAVEALIELATRREITIRDGSAAVTGLLLALILPPGIPVWMAVVGSGFSIALGKQVFGGLGANPLNPALIGRAFLTLSWPSAMTTWQWPAAAAKWLTQLHGYTDAVSSATPLGLLKGAQEIAGRIPLSHMLVGDIAGSIGETSAIALLAGGLYLIIRRIIDWRIPVAYLGTVAVLALLYRQNPLFHLLAGGLIIGAFFMATDYVTSPTSSKGRVIFGIGAGVLTMLIRLFGGYPEGVCYSILIMNAFAPLIDRFTAPRIFGEVKKHA